LSFSHKLSIYPKEIMMPKSQIRQLLLFFGAMLCVSLPSAAIAHVGGHETAGFWHGFSHPLGGIDHQVAMLAVGIWAVQIGDKRAPFIFPISFVFVMMLGGIIGMTQALPLFGTEQLIIASNIILGSFIFFGTRLPIVWSSLLIGAFAVFHGYAHGMEMPENAQGLQYALGFLIATSSLHLIGIGIGLVVQRYQQRVNVFRMIGALSVVLGLTVLAQSI
jgi:urease accessory protein